MSIVFIALFIMAMMAQAFFGWKEHNQSLSDQGAAEISFVSYFSSGYFLAATFENFQSELLQMALGI